MRRAERILLIASLLLAVSPLQAGFWRSRKAEKPAEAAPARAAVTLSAIEADASHVLLRTSGTPAYTSYSPAPTVFVVDLTATQRPADLVIPQTLPASMTSVVAEEVVEMGNRLTRVTFRFAQPITPQASASENAVLITLPVTVAEAPASAPPPAVEPPPAAVEQPVVVVEEPVAVSEPLRTPAKRLTSVKAIGSGEAIEVLLSGDGALSHKAFVLDKPARLVIDVNGVRNSAKNVTTNGAVVKGVRVGQFKTGSDPVVRVVIDMTERTPYHIEPSSNGLRVRFGSAAIAAKNQPAAPVKIVDAPAPAAVVPVEAPPPAPKAVAPASADVRETVPTIAEDATTWKMPASQGARSVITSGADQEPPDARRAQRLVSQPAPVQENVFTETQPLSGTLTPQSGRSLSGTQRVFTGEPISLNLKDADIKDVLRTFAQLTGLNIAIDPQVSGSVTVDFVDVPWDQALDLILRQNSLTFVLEGNVMRVGQVQRLTQEAEAAQKLAEQEKLNVPLQTLSFKLSYARADDVKKLLQDIASKRASIIVDTRTNQLIISEIPQYLQTMRNLIDAVDVPTRQVIIEARIVETNKTFSQEWGFTWGFRGAVDPALGTGTGLVFPNRVGFTGGPFAFGPGNPVIALTLTDVLGSFTLDLALNAAENENLVKVISAPKVMTQDNNTASIQSGVQIPYQTRINFTTTVAYIDATLNLSVTPQITEAGTIIMDISVQKTTPGDPIEGAAGTPLTTRQAKTRLMVRDGGTAVIGGIYQSEERSGESRLPVLHQIPVIGNLFKSHGRSTLRDELLIFITPRIVRS